MDVLLGDVFGVDREARSVLVALDVHGVELDWTLGAVLDVTPPARPSRLRHRPRPHGSHGPTHDIATRPRRGRLWLAALVAVLACLALCGGAAGGSKRYAGGKASPRPLELRRTPSVSRLPLRGSREALFDEKRG